MDTAKVKALPTHVRLEAGGGGVEGAAAAVFVAPAALVN